MKAHVEPAGGRRPTVPRWGHEALPLPPDLARELGRFRDEAARALADGGEEALAGRLVVDEGLDEGTAAVVARYFAEQEAFVGIPRADEVLVEESVNDDGRRDHFFHLAVGRRANDALARAFARTLSEWKKVNVGVVASDTGFALTVPRSVVLRKRDVAALFDAPVRPRLVKALESGELVKRRFRQVAERAFLLLRNAPDGTRTVGQAQVSAHVVYHALRRFDPEHPVLREAWREVLEDALDLATAEAVCADVREGRRKVRFAGNVRTPSPFAFHLVALGGEDGVVVDDRKALLRELHDRVQERLRAAPRPDAAPSTPEAEPAA